MDLSFVADMNHNNPVDFGKLAKAGCVGVIHKASQGLGFTDNKYAARRVAAKAEGVAWGAYEFNTRDDVVKSVDHFLAIAQPDEHTSLWLDFENNPKSEMTVDQARRFLDLVDMRTGRYCGIYGGNKLKELLPGPDAFFAKHPLWLCQYPKASSVQDAINRGLFKLPRPWRDVGAFLIQYTGDGIGPPPHTMDGLEKGADLSFYRGTADALRAAWPLPSSAKGVIA